MESNSNRNINVKLIMSINVIRELKQDKASSPTASSRPSSVRKSFPEDEGTQLQQNLNHTLPWTTST